MRLDRHEIRFNERRTLPFLRRTKKIYTIYSGIARAYPHSLQSEREIFVQQRILSFAGSNELYFSCMYASNGSGPIARSPLAVRRKQKSKLGRPEYTRIPRLPMEFNICCLRYETRGRAFFALFHSILLLLPRYSFFALVSQCDRDIGRERHDLCLKYTMESNELKKHQIELNSSISYALLLLECIAC